MNAEATIQKAKAIYLEMVEVEKEKSMHDQRSRECAKRLASMHAEVRQLVNSVDGPQGELRLDSPPLGIFACIEGEMHDWQRIRDDDERSIETCENCGGERVYEKKAPEGEKLEWVYTFPSTGLPGEAFPGDAPADEPAEVPAQESVQ